MDDKARLDNISLGNNTKLNYGDNNPSVEVRDIVGLVMMTIIAFSLLFAFMCSERRYRRLLEQMLEKNA